MLGLFILIIITHQPMILPSNMRKHQINGDANRDSSISGGVVAMKLTMHQLLQKIIMVVVVVVVLVVVIIKNLETFNNCDDKKCLS